MGRQTRRKFKGTQPKARPTTGEGRAPDRGPIEPLLRRIEAAGIPMAILMREEVAADNEVVKVLPSRREIEAIVEAIGMRRTSPAYPLDMLSVTGFYQSPEPGQPSIERIAKISIDQADAGARFAALHWRLYGLPNQAVDNGYKTPMNADDIQAILERAKMIERHAELTIEQREWLVDAKYAAMRRALAHCGRHVEAVVISVAVHLSMPRAAAIVALKRGLDALAGADLPSARDIPESVKLAS
jgi:hypothetical protein